MTGVSCSRQELAAMTRSNEELPEMTRISQELTVKEQELKGVDTS